MKTKWALAALGMGILCFSVRTTEAGPSLPVTKPPVQSAALLTGPPGDPPALQGQWFIDLAGQESVRTNEFYDEVLGGPAGANAITGYVDSITFLAGPGSPILAFTILATVYNDAVGEGVWSSGSNRHGESLTYQEQPYRGPLLDTKLVAEFAIADTNALPALFQGPYRDRQPYIEAVNEDQLAWYCWNPADPNSEHKPSGAYFVPTWDFGNIPSGQSSTRKLSFTVGGGGILPPPADSRYLPIMQSFLTTNDILMNRTLSLKISTWIEEIALDSLQQEEPPARLSDVSVFHNREPFLDFGDAPDGPYPTLLANDGARHLVVPGICLGTQIDAEGDGQPDANATGDDNANLADEDGVSFSTLYAGLTATVQVTVSTSGFISAWMDYDANGDWNGTNETVFSVVGVSAGTNVLAFGVPPGAAITNTFARFRFTIQQTTLSQTGLVGDGEVEDYEVAIAAAPELPTADLGDAPDSSNSWGVPMPTYALGIPAMFPTVFGAGSPPFGPKHLAPLALAWLGPGVSLENEADLGPDQDGINNLVPPLNVSDADSGGIGPGDDGVVFPLSLPHCRSTTITYLANMPAGPAVPLFANVWFDWNRDGDWNDVLTCPDGTSVPEWAVQNQPIPPGIGIVPVPSLPFFCWHPSVTPGDPLWMRITLSELSWPAPGAGLAGGDGPAVGFQFGETEDYYVTNYTLDEQLDFGDAPDANYATLLASDGARHGMVPGFLLGAQADAEADGQPDASATGDDLANVADEDGIVFTNQIVVGQRGCMDVTLVSGAAGGRLDAWVDFDRDGDWGPGEQVFTNLALAQNVNSNVCFDVPWGTRPGPTFARFRLSSAGGLPSSGAAQDGEVEDYAVTIYQNSPDTNVFAITNVAYVATNQVTIGWDGDTNAIYETQYILDLTSTASPPWTAWGPWVTGPSLTQTDTNAAETAKHYRVVAPYSPPP